MAFMFLAFHLAGAKSINASGQIACTGRYNGELGSVILTPFNVIAVVPTDEMFALLREGIGADVEALERASREAYASPLRTGMPLAPPRRDVLTALAIDERARERVRHAALDAVERSTERPRGPIEPGTLPPDDSSR